MIWLGADHVTWGLRWGWGGVGAGYGFLGKEFVSDFKREKIVADDTEEIKQNCSYIVLEKFLLCDSTEESLSPPPLP